MRIVFWIRCILVLAASSLAAANSPPALPDGMDANDWAQIEQQIQAQRFHAQAGDVSGGWQAINPAHGFQIDYQPDGQTVLTLAGEAPAEHRIALQLQGYGYGDALIPLTQAPTLSANGNTVTYQWKEGLREWWINNEQGVAQWFELAERPAMDSNDQPLVVSMTLDTGLNASVADNALTLSANEGGTTITYDRLKVWDATGRVLPAEMALDGRRLALQVDDALAVYPVTIDPTFAQQAYLKASNSDAVDEFGFSVAASGDTVVVGAPFEDSAATGVNGDPANNSAFSAGAAYVFVRNGTSWSQQAYLKAANTDTFDLFGGSVAVAGDTVVVGAPGESSAATGVNGDPANNSAFRAGAAYVFVRSGTSWSQQAYLKAANSDAVDGFGWSVAVAGDTVVVGAPFEDSAATGVNGDPADNSAFNAGAAYVFVRSGTSWSQQAYLKAANSGAVDEFGFSVAVAGDTVVVGAPSEDSAAAGVNGDSADNSADSAGAAYVFVRSGTSWSQQAYLKASNSAADDRFGVSVAIAGDTVVVGAPSEDSAATGVNGDPADNSAPFAGAAYVFVRNGSNWSQQAYLKAANSGAVDEFGFSVAVAGDTVVVGVPLEDSAATGVNGNPADNSANEAGAAYVFERAYTVSGTVTGLNGTGLVLQNNGGDELAITANGAFTFTTALDDGSAYAVTISTQPTGPNQTCSVSNGSGTLNAADITDIQIDCVTDQFTVGGTVTGLNGTGLVLQNNGGDDLPITADGAFTFPTALDNGNAYAVTVATQPTDLSQTCTVMNGTGALAGADVTNVQIECITDQFTVGGTVSGLTGTGLVLQNNGGDDLPITADGAFTFPTALDDGSAYAVTVATQPTDLSQTCTVTNDTGTLSGANITDVQIDCVTDQFTVGGTVTGLNGTGLVLQNNGGDDLPITADGAFTFATALDDGSEYDITVLTQPSTARDQQCTVSNGSGTLAGADVIAVTVDCVDITLALSTGDLDLGLVFLNASGSGTITVTNTGTADLTLDGISTPADPFSLSGGSCLNVPVTLAAAETCSLDVRFSPTAAGEFSDQIVISSNAISSPDTITLRGSSSFEPEIIPTLNTWGLLMLALVAMGGYFVRLRPSRS